MGQSPFAGNSATFYGQKYETLARKLYELQMRKNHQGFKVKCAGLIVCKNCPLIRASPDGIASCSCCGTGIIEIKCPARPQYQTMTGEEIARDGSYHLKLEHNKIRLKKESQWYTQIQTQLGASNYSWCDFVVFTRATPHLTIERIYFDKERFDKEVERSLAFHERFVMPKLLE